MERCLASDMLQQRLYSVAHRAPARGGIHRLKTLEEITIMKTLIQRFQQLHNDEAGQGLIEYVMLCALVIAAAAACFPGLSKALTDAFTAIGTKLSTYIT
jgi:Flp pilus assembly pilin Flp